MKGRPTDQLVYECMLPKPKPGDPPSFYDLLRRHLVPEVRSETISFYGSLDTPEARYPGLDFFYPPHRIRLSRFTWHERLFRAFDTLKLTPSEIAGLTKWEGTKWAKEWHEQEKGIAIRDTTGDCIHDWVDPERRSFMGDGDEECEECLSPTARPYEIRQHSLLRTPISPPPVSRSSNISGHQIPGFLQNINVQPRGVPVQRQPISPPRLHRTSLNRGRDIGVSHLHDGGTA
jgi:hypothetical protein